MKWHSAMQVLVYTGILSTVSLSAQAVTDEEFNELKARFEALADAVEEFDRPVENRATIGAYGEMHYNNLEDPAGNTSKDLSFHRFILFVGYEFSDKIRFFSEIELENSLVEDTADGSGPGEIELEQAYIEFDLTENMEAKGGLFLIPVGLINETHEPPRFYGVERNIVEKEIIPATWWEGGAVLSGRMGTTGFSYDLAVTSGLDSGVEIRDGRQKVAKANANDLAYTSRLKYTGTAGVELSGTLQYQSDMTQGLDPTIGSATLLEVHVIYDIGPVNLRALYAGWDIDVSNAATAINKTKNKQDGYYLESSWKFVKSAGVYARYNVWDNGGFGDTEKIKTEIGISYWPHEDVVLKFDIQSEDYGDTVKASEADGFNLGIGYQF